MRQVGETVNSSAELHLDGGGNHTITIRCADIWDDTAKLIRAVNTFEALVSALTPFRSSEMGALLVENIDTREPNGEAAQKRLAHLVAMIDVILDAAAEPDEVEAR
jgi:hypothetical protein